MLGTALARCKKALDLYPIGAEYLCPARLGLLKQISALEEAGAREDQMSGTEKLKSIPVVSPPATSPAQKRMCRVGGCVAVLSYNNNSGLCHEHRGRAPRAHSKTNGHAATIHFPAGRGEPPHRNDEAVRKANAHGNGPGKTNAHENNHALAIEERVNRVLAGIPLADKVTMISGWLAGKC